VASQEALYSVESVNLSNLVKRISIVSLGASKFLSQLTVKYQQSQEPGELSLYNYRLDDRSSISGRGKRIFSTPQRPHRLWGPPSLLSNGYRG
jgi:hypothetical protein